MSSSSAKKKRTHFRLPGPILDFAKIVYKKYLKQIPTSKLSPTKMSRHLRDTFKTSSPTRILKKLFELIDVDDEVEEDKEDSSSSTSSTVAQLLVDKKKKTTTTSIDAGRVSKTDPKRTGTRTEARTSSSSKSKSKKPERPSYKTKKKKTHPPPPHTSHTTRPHHHRSHRTASSSTGDDDITLNAERSE